MSSKRCFSFFGVKAVTDELPTLTAVFVRVPSKMRSCIHVLLKSFCLDGHLSALGHFELFVDGMVVTAHNSFAHSGLTLVPVSRPVSPDPEVLGRNEFAVAI